jgi:hypothetical protein
MSSGIRPPGARGQRSQCYGAAAVVSGAGKPAPPAADQSDGKIQAITDFWLTPAGLPASRTHLVERD